MAIVQVSRITNRKGLQENLPQLAGAELGWATDSRRLFIGNGTLQDGAPVIGNTEILTEFSDITVVSNYTYTDVVVGYAAQTGPTPGDPVVRSVQAKLDDTVSVRDFGAVGDGVADDTEAINRALYQLYCREATTQPRRTLLFPAGTYRIIESLMIPTWAKLVGEGANHSIILLDTSSDISSLSAYVARLADSLQQTGANIGTNNATPPQNIEISSMTFQTVEDTDIFLVDQAKEIWFQNVYFVGPTTQAEIENSNIVPLPDIAGIRFNSSTNLLCNTITFDNCGFNNITYGIATDENFAGVNVTNSGFNTLYQGVVLNGGGTGFRVLHNTFDIIYGEGVDYSDVNLCVSGYNIFYNVGNSIGASSPTAPVVSLGNDTCVSANDLFARTESDAYTIPRVRILTSTTVSGGTQMQMGRYARESGLTFSLANNQTNQTIFSVNNDNTKAFQMYYTISRATSVRSGIMTVVSGPNDSAGDLDFTDDYTENSSTGITLNVTQSGSQVALQYTSTNTGIVGTLTYSLSHLA